MELKSSEIVDYVSSTTDIPNFVWASSRRLLTPWIPDRFGFAFNNPSIFDSTGGIPSEVFERLLYQLSPEGTFTEGQMIKLITAFSSATNRDEWTHFYQPILKRIKPDNISIGWHNTHAPEEYSITPFEVQRHINNHPSGIGHFYPLIKGASHIFVFITPTTVEGLTTQFTKWDITSVAEQFYEMIGKKDIDYPLVFEGYWDDQDIYLCDVFTLSTIDKWNGSYRRQLLEEYWSDYLNKNDHILLGEGIYETHNADLGFLKNHFESITGVSEIEHALFKPTNQSYNISANLISLKGVITT